MQDFYGNKYKKMMLIPTIIAIILLIVIFVLPLFLPGIFHGITPGVDLTGGNVLVLRSTKSITEAQLTGVLKENFSLKELKVSTIASPTGYGAWIQYSNDPIITNMEELISKANTSLNAENEEDSIAFSAQALKLMNKPDQNFDNAKVALLAAQTALHEYKGDFSKKLQDTISQKLGLGNNAEFQRREISPTLGAASFSSSIFITILGIIMIVIIIFIAFRQFVPSAAIIQAMLFDVLSGLAGMAFLNIPLSLTTLPALLMLIGYSVDTDILLTSRMLKGKDGTPAERATASMKTGLTMTGTTLGTLVVMLIVSYFYQIEVIYQISAILFFGLIGDIISTWLMNAPVLLWWLEKKEKARKY
jgi:preprotein translocase subunit SecF